MAEYSREGVWRVKTDWRDQVRQRFKNEYRTEERLAQKAKISRGTVSRFLNNTGTERNKFVAICEALKFDPDEVGVKGFTEPRNSSDKPDSGRELEEEASGDKPRLSSHIQDKTHHFVGREYIFDAFEEFRRKYRRGYFSLVGDPGEGKSSIAAELVKRNKENPYLLYHFNQRKQGPRTAEQFLRNICGQLTTSTKFRVSERTKSLESYTDGVYLQEILDEISTQLNGYQLVIVVDALDEVETVHAKELESNILYLPQTLPEGVYFFLTRRRDSNLKGRLSFGRDQCVFDFLDYGEETEIGQKILTDVRKYIENHLDSQKYPEYANDVHAWLLKSGISKQRFITALSQRSQRNFLYLYNVLPEFKPGGIYQNLEGLDTLPEGLMDFYKDHWQRMGMTREDRSDVEIYIIYLLTEIYDWVPISIIAEYARINTRRPVTEITVAKYFERWRQFLHIEQIENENTYLIYHESFNDFLQKDDTVKSARVDASRIKSDYGAAMFGGLDSSEEEDD